MAEKMYRRPDGLYEKILIINGRRVAFRAKSTREVLRKIAAYREPDGSWSGSGRSR